MRAGRLWISVFVLVTAGTFSTPSPTHADEVLDWNRVACRVVTTAPATAPPLAARILAMTHAAVYDAHNGIERRFTAIHVGLDEAAPQPGASRRAAVVQAAFAVLLAQYPAQADALLADRAASLAGIAAEAAGDSQSIQGGLEWGQYVAERILAWRAADGVFPLMTDAGSLDVGAWRPTPPAFAPGFGLTLGQAVPFVVPTASTFRPAGPPPLSSLEYAVDLEEVQRVGEAVTTARTADQTEAARFWAGTAPTFWNRTAVDAAERRHTTLSQNARLFALMNMAMADTNVTIFEAKYHYRLWRPLHAIRLADTDGNPLTVAQIDWEPFLANPPYPEYPSGHQSLSGAAATVLTAYFGDMPTSGTSEGLPGVTRNWPSFEAAADEASMARIWAGIHFQSAMRDTRACARAVAAYVLEHAARPLNGTRAGQVGR
jgi:hypothetical protein